MYRRITCRRSHAIQNIVQRGKAQITRGSRPDEKDNLGITSQGPLIGPGYTLFAISCVRHSLGSRRLTQIVLLVSAVRENQERHSQALRTSRLVTRATGQYYNRQRRSTSSGLFAKFKVRK